MATEVPAVRVVQPSRAMPATVASAAQRAQVDSVAMVVLVRTPPVEVQRWLAATADRVAAAGWVAQVDRAAARSPRAPTAMVAMEVPAARPELPATVVMGARVILQTQKVQPEVMAGILEPQELVVRVVLPESVELQVRLGSAARPDPTRHSAVMGVMVEMGLLP